MKDGNVVEEIKTHSFPLICAVKSQKSGQLDPPQLSE